MRSYLPITLSIIAINLMGITPVQAVTSEEVTMDSVTASSTSWKNQSGSTMSLTFTQDPSNTKVMNLTGNYINNAPGFSCQGTPYPITGRYYPATLTLSFNVVWSNAYADCQSVTGWTGYFQFASSNWQIMTGWNLAYENGSGQGTIASGSDVFTMTSTTLYASPMADE